MDCFNRAKALQEEIVAHRRALHQIPELQLELPKTVAYLRRALEECEISYELLVDGNAIVATVGTGQSPCIAIRADMDALPIEEETGLPFSSLHKGCMHACGHDGHAAMALVAAKILKEREKELDGTVKIFFQPGEEIPGGAYPMIQEGCMENPKVEAIVGLHEGGILTGVPCGSIGIRAGSMFASMDRFSIEVFGKGGHGAQPHQGVDPIQILSEINMGLQKIISRELPPTTPGLISVCQIHGGTTQNIIPDSVWEEGTARALSREAQDLIETRVKEISEGIAKAYRGRAEVNYERFYPVLINDEDFTAFFEDIAVEALGRDKVVRLLEPTMGGEDMAFFLQEVPGTYFLLSNAKVHEDGTVYPHHNSRFDVDEDQFYKGTGLLAETCWRYLKGGTQ